MRRICAAALMASVLLGVYGTAAPAEEKLNATQREELKAMREALKAEEQEDREAVARKNGRSADADLDEAELEDDGGDLEDDILD